MRPLELKIKGLRSYRDEQRIDFGDRTLVAVIGDTGAGKSSLLEAITFALFGVATWEKANRDLISDYADVMQVDFTFSAVAERWRVTRARRRSGPSVDRLENIDSGDRVDGAKAVTTKIESLLGLDYDTFLQTVILPQGRFDTLLKSSDADRVKVLKRLFSVEALGRVREIAKQRRTNADYALAALAQTRERFRADPARAAEAAEAEAQAAADAQRAIDRAKNEARSVVEAAKKAEKRVDSIAEAVAALDVRGLREAEKEAKQMAALSRASRGQLEKALLAQDAARVVRDRARDDLSKVAASVGDARTLAAVRNSIGGVSQQADSLRSTIERMHSSILSRDEAEHALKEARTAKAAAAKALELAAERQDDAANRAASAQAALDRFDDAKHALVAAQRTAAACEDQATATAVERKDAEDESTAATDALTRASAALDETVAERDRLTADHALAHATANLVPGDPCPVCATVLGPSFKPPRSPSLTSADRLVTKATTAHRDAQTRDARASARIQELTARAKTESKAATSAKREVERTTSALAMCSDLDVTSAHHTDAALSQARRTMAKSAEGAAKTADRLAKELAKADDAWRNADKRAGEAEVRATAKAEAASSLASAVETQLAELQATNAALPPKLRPKLGRITGKIERLQTTDIVVEDHRALTELLLQEKALGSAETAVVSSQDKLEEADQALREAEKAYESEVVGPLRGLTRRLRALAPAVRGLNLVLDSPPSPVEPTDDTAAAVADWSSTLHRSAKNAVPASERARTNAMRDLDKQRASLTRLLDSAGAEDLDQLEVLRGLAVARAKQADAELQSAKAEISYVRELDKRLKAVGAFRDGLRLLEANLTDGTFIGDLLHRRQKALLGIATVRLGEMSGGRYGFSEDFEIVDRDTGLPRSTRTLSGGESFQASLAFALAMVELAGRGGSRVDALFLDEGFGSLDARSLSDALDLLEQRSETGRLITIISHVREVADRIDDVLAVTNGASGSELHWLTRAERDRLASADVEQTLSGLLG